MPIAMVNTVHFMFNLTRTSILIAVWLVISDGEPGLVSIFFLPLRFGSVNETDKSLV